MCLDVEDRDLRTRNQSVILWNIYEDNTKKGKTSFGGMADMVGYLRKLPTPDQATVMQKLNLLVQEGNA